MYIEERSVNERIYKDVWLDKYDESLPILYSRYVNDVIYFVFKEQICSALFTLFKFWTSEDKVHVWI